MGNLRVRDIMSQELITLQSSETLDLADEIMKLARVRHLPVTDGEALVGLVTHRDLLNAQVSALADLTRGELQEIRSEIPCSMIMQKDVRTVTPDMTALEAARLLEDHKYGCLPVVEDGILVGIITEADFLHLVVKALEKD